MMHLAVNSKYIQIIKYLKVWLKLFTAVTLAFVTFLFIPYRSLKILFKMLLL